MSNGMIMNSWCSFDLKIGRLEFISGICIVDFFLVITAHWSMKFSSEFLFFLVNSCSFASLTLWAAFINFLVYFFVCF